jgi:hypothetical protein
MILSFFSFPDFPDITRPFPDNSEDFDEDD